jgi:hypothetical protein
MSCLCPRCHDAATQIQPPHLNHKLDAPPPHYMTAVMTRHHKQTRSYGYLATFVVCLVLGSPIGFMAAALTVRLLSLTSRIHHMPVAACIAWVVVAITFQIAGFKETQRYNREGQSKIQHRKMNSSCDACSCVLTPWFDQIRHSPAPHGTFLSEA